MKMWSRNAQAHTARCTNAIWKRRRCVACALFGGISLCFLSEAGATDLRATVTRVIDGDTFIAENEEKARLVIRLKDIDCPEIDQPYGQESKALALGMMARQSITLSGLKKDKYERALALAILDDGRIVNHELVRLGACWKYSKADDPVLQGLEDSARTKQIGLWAQANPTAPWDFRKAQRLKEVGVEMTVGTWGKLNKRERILYLSGIMDGSGQDLHEREERALFVGTLMGLLDGFSEKRGDEESIEKAILAFLRELRNADEQSKQMH